MKRIIKKIIGALILLVFFGMIFASDVIKYGLLFAVVAWIIVAIITALIILAAYLLSSD